VQVDLFGLRLPVARAGDLCAAGVVVALDPGVITVRLELAGETADVTVSPGRVQRH
jgi:hypothetical protein